MTQTPTPKLSIIFPNLDGGKILETTIKSLINSDYPRLEIIVVDNGSKENIKNQISKTKVEKRITDSEIIKIIQNKKNLGFAKAVNQGASVATGDYLFITNNDVSVPKKFFNELVSFAQGENVDVTGPEAYKYNLYTGLFRKAKRGEIPDWIPGYALLVKARVWKRLGGFDEGFFFTFEDLDFCVRAKKQGMRILTCPRLTINHQDGATVNRKEYLDFKYYQSYKSKIRFILKHGALPQKITNLTLQYLIYTPYRSLILHEKSFIPLLRATLWNLHGKK